MNQTLHGAPLGRPSAYVDQYQPALLYPLARAPKRAEISIQGSSPFLGADLWNAYELSWLNPRGKPQIAIAQLVVPCDSANLIESKSLKLYLNSFNNSRFDSAEQVRQRLRADLSEALSRGSDNACDLGVQLIEPALFEQQRVQELEGLNLDRLEVECHHEQPAPELLRADFDLAPVQEVLCSRLLKSNCLVTGQPDWGSIQISYSGAPIDQAGLLRYLVSFRNHNEFHEQCVERIFVDLQTHCRPLRLSVYARYTRRGGLDINPYRTSHAGPLPANLRTARQ